MGLYKQYLKPDDAREGYHEPTMSTKPPSKSRNMRAEAKKTPMCSVSLIAIELKGLAAPGEALKILAKPSTQTKSQNDREGKSPKCQREGAPLLF